jgi:prophage regulatory protein
MRPRALSDRIVRPAEVAEALGVSKVTLWRMRRRGDLPAPLRISANAVGWRESTVSRWLDEREEAGS